MEINRAIIRRCGLFILFVLHGEYRVTSVAGRNAFMVEPISKVSDDVEFVPPK